MKISLILSIIAFFYSQLIIPQSNSENTFHPLSNTLGITLDVGSTLPLTDYKINELDITGRLITEYFFTSRSIHAFGIRLFTGAGYINAQVFSNKPVFPPVSDKYRTGLFYAGGGFVYAIRLGYSVPYISAATSYLKFDPGDTKGNQLPGNSLSLYKKETVVYTGEIGVKFPFSKMWSLNLGLNLNFAETDYLDDIKAGLNNDAFLIFFTGFSLLLGGSYDIDNDGVEDDIDICPDTKEGELVDEFGCSIIPKNYDNYSYDISNEKFITNGIFSDGKLYCFQIYVYRSFEDAVMLKNRITQLGYQSYIFEVTVGNRIWFSVRVGYFDSLNNTRIFREDFFKKINIKP